MRTLRKFCLAIFGFIFILSSCAQSPSSDASTSTPRPTATKEASAEETPTPAASRLQVEKEALRGLRVRVWHPWFGAEASLFESQVAQFNTENEWGIIVEAQSMNNFSELFLQTEAALENATQPDLVIALPEHALGWMENVLDLNAYIQDPLYGISALERSEFPSVIWRQDEVEGKRLGMPAQRTGRFILYNRTWARELGFDSPPTTPSDFEQQACAANRALREDADPNNDLLGGWLIDTHAATSLSWMIAFGGGVQEENGYRFLTSENIEAFKYLKKLQLNGCAWVASPEIPTSERFAARQALFATAALEDLPEQTRAFTALGSRDDWTVLAFPGEERDAVVIYGSSFVIFESDEPTQLASWLFVRWMLSAENQARWVQSTGLFPLRDSTMSLLTDYSATHPQWADAVKLLPQGVGTPQLSSWRLVRVMMEDAFRDMFDTIRHPDLTEGQVPLILRQMEETAEEIAN
ncbi:MAG TPA: extracellular solute-binding protein [Anaerolineales bacterium]|nr:extracellular solute-binding protein [Anaerolineales bacterium]